MKIHVRCPECGGEVRWEVRPRAEVYQYCGEAGCGWEGSRSTGGGSLNDLQAALVKALAMLQEVLTHGDGWSGMEERICHFCGAERDFGRNEPCADDCLITRIKALDAAKREEE